MKISNYAALGAVIITGFGGAVYLMAQSQKRAVQTKNCQINLKQIGLAMLQYSRDYDEHYPPTANWAQTLSPYLPHSTIYAQGAALQQTYRCPTTGNFYAYNRNLQTLTMGQILPLEGEPLVIEVAAGQTKQNLSGAGELWPLSPIHETADTRGNNVLFADGHTELRQNKPTFRKFAPLPKPTATPRPSVKAKQKP